MAKSHAKSWALWRLARPDRSAGAEKGKDMGSAIKGWDEVAKQLGKHVEPVIEFLKNFTPGE
jgi:hypothetical protein